ncbi:Der GTPase-activating protein YihI [Paraferrimonas sp. SM1919]|uniref:Der GTPase-activating protein YihI n=1 Tax=Paraferrimonas sp. SM1919 TaxID=2662263 RepID=UPI0013D587EA|nr:Der GTPase-activating protein YihI [Paraferrimonas sp. SM1919]
MTRKKKSRVLGSHGPQLKPKEKSVKVESKKKGKGKSSGSRNAFDSQSQSASNKHNKAVNPMLGSKKPISLTATVATTKQTQVERLSDRDAEILLMQIENDPRLNRLLDKVEQNAVLAKQDRKWMNQQLRRIEELMEQLGISLDDEELDFIEEVNIDAAETKPASDEDRLDSFDSAQDFLESFKDK